MKKEDILKKIFTDKAYIVSPLVGGMMNESYIISDNDKKYVLYISTEQANEMVDRALERKHLSIAYSLGITSKNFYFDVDHGIKANEYIEGESLDKLNEFDYTKVAEVFHKLHDSKELSPQDYLPFERLKGYETEAISFIKEYSSEYLVLRDVLMENKAYLEMQKKVFCHNDVQRSNIVRANNGEYYIIDYEFVGNNDEIYDIACFGNGDVEEGYKLLNAYFKKLTFDQEKRYFLWRIYISLQWYNVALVKHYRGEGELHGFNFLAVADHFLNNAKEAYRRYQVLLSERGHE